jgi:hypothetical protein
MEDIHYPMSLHIKYVILSFHIFIELKFDTVWCAHMTTTYMHVHNISKEWLVTVTIKVDHPYSLCKNCSGYNLYLEDEMVSI